MEVIANIRTDSTPGLAKPASRPRLPQRSFGPLVSEVEQAVLVNHGYALIDAAIRTHALDLIAMDAAFTLPFPAFAPPDMVEDELRRRLMASEKRKVKGRS